MPSKFLDNLERDGFAILEAALDQQGVAAVAAGLEVALDHADRAAGPIRKANDTAVASRNLLRLWPGVFDLARTPAIRNPVARVLGEGCGLVRALYFDKPPGGSWSLPWHKDLTIAVREHRGEGTQFTKPTVKGGVPHVEAPECVLRRMLTARLHLDDVTEENGPLLVVPGSHRDGKTPPPIAGETRFQPILLAAGDALLMRPLVTHCSRHSRSSVERRRTVHLEFAAGDPLPDGYAWFEFHRLMAGDNRSAPFES